MSSPTTRRFRRRRIDGHVHCPVAAISEPGLVPRVVERDHLHMRLHQRLTHI